MISTLKEIWQEIWTEEEIIETSDALRSMTTCFAYAVMAILLILSCFSNATLLAKCIGCFVLASTLPVFWFADYNADISAENYKCKWELAVAALLGWTIQLITAFTLLGGFVVLASLFTK